MLRFCFDSEKFDQIKLFQLKPKTVRFSYIQMKRFEKAVCSIAYLRKMVKQFFQSN